MTLSHFFIFRDRDRDIGSDLVTKLTIPNKLRISNSNIDIKGKAIIAIYILSNIFFLNGKTLLEYFNLIRQFLEGGDG